MHTIYRIFIISAIALSIQISANAQLGITTPMKVNVVAGGVTNTSMAVTGNVNMNPTNIVKVVGLAIVTNLIVRVDTTATGVASGDVLAPGIEVTGAVRTAGGTGFLKCVRYAAGDNNAPAVRLLITSQPILDWPVTNSVMSFNAFTNNPYVLGGVDITSADFRPWGTNYYATKDCSFGISAATNSIFIYAGCAGAITNSNSASVKLYILQD